ncbi:MAG TPA: efflux RND transporter periplasmic adaptor subunit [Polyangiaceae bacterium]|nr:efflux RND transporter periplasmic adaptor subunit [Polyangiaceae bacterium]
MTSREPPPPESPLLTEPPLGDTPAKAEARPRTGYSGWALLIVGALSGVVGSAATFLALQQLGSGSPFKHEHASEAPLYQCPMHPTIIQDHPGNCPICGMKLVKVEKSKVQNSVASAPGNASATHGAAGSGPGTASSTPTPSVPGLASVEIDPERQQLIGLRTAEVTRGPVGGAWRTVGRVAIDETRVRHVNLKIPGFVERIYVDYIGKKVGKGDPLFSIYSPELLSAQEEYLLARKTQTDLSKMGGPLAPSDDGMVAAARRKLELWDISAAEMDNLVRTGQPKKSMTLYSPASGVVTKKDVVEGMKLDAGAMPYEIVDLSSVWVLADVYESELRFIKQGMSANLTLAAFPNREFKGKVVFLDPLLDPQTRTVKVRLTFPNPTGELRPEMFGDVVLFGAAHEGLRVPPDAIIDSGIEKVVFVAVGAGKFEPRRVQVGNGDETFVEVVSGLEPGERVVVRANFLIDSESRLRASLSAVGREENPIPPAESARVLPGSVNPNAVNPNAAAANTAAAASGAGTPKANAAPGAVAPAKPPQNAPGKAQTVAPSPNKAAQDHSAHTGHDHSGHMP